MPQPLWHQIFSYIPLKHCPSLQFPYAFQYCGTIILYLKNKSLRNVTRNQNTWSSSVSAEPYIRAWARRVPSFSPFSQSWIHVLPGKLWCPSLLTPAPLPAHHMGGNKDALAAASHGDQHLGLVVGRLGVPVFPYWSPSKLECLESSDHCVWLLVSKKNKKSPV